MRTMLCTLLVLVIASGNPGPAAAQTGAEPLESLIARVLAAYGGAALPTRGSMFRATGRNWSIRRGAEGAILRELRWPDYLRVEIAYEDGGHESRLLAGGRGWRDGTPAPRPLVAAMRLQAARLALPMLLKWKSDHVRDLGEARRGDGTEVRRLAIDLTEDPNGGGKSAETLFVEIRREDARILRSAGVMEMGGNEVSFGAAYADFAAIGPLSWPRQEDQSAMGQATGWTRIESIEVGLQPDPDAFRP